jgi:ankyrin repeat protein
MCSSVELFWDTFLFA